LTTCGGANFAEVSGSKWRYRGDGAGLGVTGEETFVRRPYETPERILARPRSAEALG